ncbi:Large ribosomal subunit protein uL23 [Candidatus Magnetomoraceae bacterium gMMP-15]
MESYYSIIKQPFETEKTRKQREAVNQFSFEVNSQANRVEIRRAVENIFDVRVTGVRTMNVKGKKKQRGRIQGKRKDWKKAIITLAPGERIEFFDGV